MTKLIIALIATALLSTGASATGSKPKCKPSTAAHHLTCTSDYAAAGVSGARR